MNSGIRCQCAVHSQCGYTTTVWSYQECKCSSLVPDMYETKQDTAESKTKYMVRTGYKTSSPSVQQCINRTRVEFNTQSLFTFTKIQGQIVPM